MTQQKMRENYAAWCKRKNVQTTEWGFESWQAAFESKQEEIDAPATYPTNTAEVGVLVAEITRLNHQHANDEAANRMLSDVCARQSMEIDALTADRDHWKGLETEAANYVEIPLVLRTHFTGEPPYVGWEGLGLALTETLDGIATDRERVINECAALFSGGARNREMCVNDVEEMILGLVTK